MSIASMYRSAAAALAIGTLMGAAPPPALTFPPRERLKPKPTLHPTKGWRGPGTYYRGANRRRGRAQS